MSMTNGADAQQMHYEQEQQNNSSSPSSSMKNQSDDGECRKSLIVNYLPQTMTEDEIRSLFSSVGEVENVKLIRDKSQTMVDPMNPNMYRGQSLGYAFVNYVRPQDADQAVNVLNGLRLQNKTIKVSFARPSSDDIKGASLYVSGLPIDITQQEFDSIFEPFGTIINSRVLTKENQSKAIGFVRFDKREEATRAIIALNGTTPKGCPDPIVVKFSNVPGNNTKMIQPQYPQFMNTLPRGARVGGAMHNPVNKGLARFSPMAGDMIDVMLPNGLANSPNGGYSIYIFNLAPDAEESILWKLFGPFGAVQSVRVIKDQATNQCKGYGFVTMPNYDEAVMAIRALNGYTLANRVLQVSFKTQKSK